jgi:hypothetical protein
MGSKEVYELEIKVDAPKKVVVDEKYEIVYTIKNQSKEPFPGGSIIIEMRWASIGQALVNSHLIRIEKLAPDEFFEPPPYEQIDEVSGMTYLSRPEHPQKGYFKADDGKLITLFLPNGNEIPPGQVIHTLRVKSVEEVSQVRANWIAAGSLIILIIIELVKWMFGIFG